MKNSKISNESEYIKFKPINEQKEKRITKNNSKFLRIMCDNQFLVIFDNIPVK